MTDQISKVFGVEEKAIERLPRVQNSVPATLDDLTTQMVENRKADYTAVRDNLLNLLQDMGQVIGGAIDNVLTDPTARILEAFSGLARTYADINKDLISLSEQAPKQKTSDSEQKPINNVVFVGTSDSLIDRIKQTIRIIEDKL